MKTVKEYRKKALIQYEDLRDTIAVIEAMSVQGLSHGIGWENLQKKLNAKAN